MKSHLRSVLADRVMELGPPAPPDAATGPWRLSRDQEGIAWLVLDEPGQKVNTLSAAVLSTLDGVLAQLTYAPPRALVIRSGKPGGFIAGADIGAFREAGNTGEVEQLLGTAHDVVDRLETVTFPTVAVVHGYCLGGGLELALACKRRLAVAGAKLGFPEVMLGLHPGLGGTARATRLIDPVEAMTLMLTGRSIDAGRAKKLGLVDAVVEERHVRDAVRAAAAGTLGGAKPGLKTAALNSAPARRFAAARMRASTAQKVRPEHYPAPFALIDLWERHGGSKAAMLAAETASFARLVTGETAQNLIRVFFLRETLKKAAPSAKADFAHVHVVGAGTMGGDIAAWCAFQGLRVTLQDVDAKAMAGAVTRAAELYGKLSRRGTEVRDALDRLMPDPRGLGIQHADVVIEAVAEKVESKRGVFQSVEPFLKPGAILATNTSSIPLEDLYAGLQSPGRLVGLHFFNPVSRMQLVEVVHDVTATETLDRALAFVGRIDRLPAPVKSAPGFIVNRALTPYLLEAMLMLDEGVGREAIDEAARRFGMPVGPLELADEVGLDICLGVGEILSAKLNRPLPAAPVSLRKKVEAGELGRKSGKGFYEWKDGKPVKASTAETLPDQTATDRLILPILNACVGCLQAGTVADEDTLDAAMIFGAGFAPFRGGPLRYARERGIGAVVAALRGLAQRHGDRFAPDFGWDKLRGE